MFKSHLQRALAVTLGVAAIAGCSTRAGLMQPATPRHAGLAAGAFSAPLKAPANVSLPSYHTQALAMFPHLIGAAFPDSKTPPPTAQNPALAYDSQDDTYMVVWYSSSKLWLRIKDAHGTVQVPDLNFVSGSPKPWPEFKVTYIAHLNQFAIVYAVNGGATGKDLYLQRVSASGALVGAPLPITTAAGDQDDPDLAYDPVNQRLEVVWDDNRSGNFDIYGRLLGFNGNQTVFLTNETLVGNSAPDPTNNYAEADQTHPTIAFGSAQQRYVVAWTDADGDGLAINGTVLDANGVAVNSDFSISDLAEDQSEPSIAYLPVSDKFLIAFSSTNNGAADEDLLGAGLDGDGSLLGTGTISNQYGMQHAPSVAANNTSMTWLVTYQEDLTMPPDAPPPTPSHVMGRHIGWAFQLGDIFAVTPNNTLPDGCAAAVGNTDDQEFLVDYVQGPSGKLGDVWGQRVDRGY